MRSAITIIGLCGLALFALVVALITVPFRRWMEHQHDLRQAEYIRRVRQNQSYGTACGHWDSRHDTSGMN